MSELRLASLRFKANPATTCDGLAPRHVALLGDCGLQLLAAVLKQAEARGSLPKSMCAVAYFLFGKPNGGLRAIGSMTAVYRVWAKSRAHRAACWEASRRDPYFATGSCIDEVWRQSCQAEVATQSGLVAAGIYWDLTSFLETVKPDDLLQRLHAVGYPPVLVAMPMNLFATGARYITYKGRAAEAAFALRGHTSRRYVRHEAGAGVHRHGYGGVGRCSPRRQDRVGGRRCRARARGEASPSCVGHRPSARRLGRHCRSRVLWHVGG